MAYFLILPAFVVWLIVAGVSTVIAKKFSRFPVAYPFVWRISVWATLGFVVANVLLIVLLALGFIALEDASADHSSSRDTFQIVWGLTAIGGPVIVSVLGWLLGAVAGVVLALIHYKRAA